MRTAINNEITLAERAMRKEDVKITELKTFYSNLITVKFFMRDFKSNLRKLATTYLEGTNEEEFRQTEKDLEKFEEIPFMTPIKCVINRLLIKSMTIKEALEYFDEIQESAEEMSKKIFDIIEEK